MKNYAHYKGDTFKVNHTSKNLDDHVDAIWLDIQDKELIILYLPDTQIETNENINIQIFDNQGNITEAYILKLELKDKNDKHISYTIKKALCHFDFDD